MTSKDVEQTPANLAAAFALLAELVQRVSALEAEVESQAGRLGDAEGRVDELEGS